MLRIRAIALLVAGAAAAVALPAPARAHAILVDSSPHDGDVLARPPGQVVLRFNSRIEKRLTRVALAADGGGPVALPPGPYGAEDAPDRITIPVPPLAPGRYRLTYRVLAVDGHSTPGLLRFSVRPAP